MDQINTAISRKTVSGELAPELGAPGGPNSKKLTSGIQEEGQPTNFDEEQSEGELSGGKRSQTSGAESDEKTSKGFKRKDSDQIQKKKRTSKSDELKLKSIKRTKKKLDDESSLSSSDFSMSSSADRKSVNKSRRSAKRTSSNSSSSVSDLLSESDHKESSSPKPTAQDSSSSSPGGHSSSSPKRRAKIRRRRAKSTSSSSSSSSNSSELDEDEELSDSSESNNDEDVELSSLSNTPKKWSKKSKRSSDKKQDVEEGEIIEQQQQQQQSQSVPINPKQLQILKEQIHKVKKKCGECEAEIRRCVKSVKKGKKLTAQSIGRDKVKYEMATKKQMKKKKKLEKKFLIYRTKLSSLTAKHSMIVKDQSEVNQGNNRRIKHKSKDSNNKRRDDDEDNDEDDDESNLDSNHKASSLSNAQTSSNLKLPYPVLNDKREPKLIINILKEKHRHLNEMLEQALATLDNLRKSNEQGAEVDAKRVRLENLEENIKSQLSRLNRQIDYVSFNSEISKIKKFLESEENLNEESIDRLKKKMNELSKRVDGLFMFMKDANKKFAKQQEMMKQQQNQSQETESDSGKSNLAQGTSDSIRGSASSNSVPISYYRNVPPPMLTGPVPKNQLPPPFPPNNQHSPGQIPPISNPNLGPPQKSPISKPQQLYRPRNEPRDDRSLNEDSKFGPKSNFNYRQNNEQTNQTPHDNYNENKFQENKYNQRFNRKTNESNYAQQQQQSNHQQYPSNQSQNFASMFANMLQNQAQQSQESTPNGSGQLERGRGDHNQNRDNFSPKSRSSRHSHSPSGAPVGGNVNSSNANGIPGTGPINQSWMSNLPAMLNSPAFVSTMASMLTNMAQQGVNVNNIINSMPMLLRNFANDYNAQQRSLPTGQTNNYNPNKHGRDNYESRGSYSGYKANNSSENINQNPGSSIEDPLLPNPPTNMSQFSKSFYNYISNYAQNMSKVESNNKNAEFHNYSNYNEQFNYNNNNNNNHHHHHPGRYNNNNNNMNPNYQDNNPYPSNNAYPNHNNMNYSNNQQHSYYNKNNNFKRKRH